MPLVKAKCTECGAPIEVNPMVSRGLNDIILKAMEKKQKQQQIPINLRE